MIFFCSFSVGALLYHPNTRPDQQPHGARNLTKHIIKHKYSSKTQNRIDSKCTRHRVVCQLQRLKSPVGKTIWVPKCLARYRSISLYFPATSVVMISVSPLAPSQPCCLCVYPPLTVVGRSARTDGYTAEKEDGQRY